MDKLTFYLGRNNSKTIGLYRQDEDDPAPILVPINTVTSVQLKFGPHCLDTEVDTTIFTLINDATAIKVIGGQLADLTPGEWVGQLTVFDGLNPDGLAWVDLAVEVVSWPIC